MTQASSGMRVLALQREDDRCDRRFLFPALATLLAIYRNAIILLSSHTISCMFAMWSSTWRGKLCWTLWINNCNI